MALAIVVADASALISLRWVDQLSILPALFGRIVMPPSAAAEATRRGFSLPSWVDLRPLGRAVDPRVSKARLGAGESEVLSLGLELPGAWLILDDGEARALARQLGLRMLGTAACLVEAKRAGLLPAVRPVLDLLLARGFRLSPKVYDLILGPRASDEDRILAPVGPTRLPESSPIILPARDPPRPRAWLHVTRSEPAAASFRPLPEWTEHLLAIGSTSHSVRPS